MKIKVPLALWELQNNTWKCFSLRTRKGGKGAGKALLQYGIEQYSVHDLAVNEQNPLAKGFYEHMGFTVYKRTERDEQGNPYPLLYMKRGVERRNFP